ncbi:MAG: LCCL domain-containing protein, partial [Gemmataceae bacterium]
HRPNQHPIGQTLAFRVTGPPPKTAGAWGTTVYTLDSRLAVAAVHAGVLESGQTATVRVIVLGPQPAFQASNQNGITSSPYGAYPGYQILPR